MPQKALRRVEWDGHAVAWLRNQVLGAKPQGEMGASQAASPAFSWLLAAGGAGLGEPAGGWGLPAAQGTPTQGGTGLYLFGVVSREDSIPIELLQNILELLGGVWGDKGTVLSMAPLGCFPHPPAGWCRVVYLLDMQFLDPSVPGRGHPCPASPSTFRGQGRYGKLSWQLYIYRELPPTSMKINSDPEQSKEGVAHTPVPAALVC